MNAPDPCDTAFERLAGFGRFLQANGFGIGAGAAAPALQTALDVGLFERDRLRWSLKALLCGRADEWRRFDELFDAWFLPPNRWAAPAPRDTERTWGVPSAAHPSARGAGSSSTDPDGAAPSRSAASAHEGLHVTDFRELTAREHLIDIEALLRRLVQRLPSWVLRRETRAPQGRRLLFGATLRRSLASGGTPFQLAWKHKRRVRPRLVLLIDVSRSMAAYSFFYLRLARALGALLPRSHEVQSFVFHTGLTAVSRALHDADPWRAQEQLQRLAQGFGGGTRIGECLSRFNAEFAPGCLHGRSAVLIFSDGYDSGPPALLAQALQGMRRRVRRIVWLNPLAALPGFAPLSQGLQAALPLVDAHLPAHDLASLEAALPQALAALR